MKKVEAEYWARDNLCESEYEKSVIDLAEDSSSDEDLNLLLWHLMQFKKLQKEENIKEKKNHEKLEQKIKRMF